MAMPIARALAQSALSEQVVLGLEPDGQDMVFGFQRVADRLSDSPGIDVVVSYAADVQRYEAAP